MYLSIFKKHTSILALKKAGIEYVSILISFQFKLKYEKDNLFLN